jgi:transposase
MPSSSSELPSRNELPELLRSMIEGGRVEETIDLVVRVIDQISEAHARTLLDLKRALKARYGRRSEKLSEEQLELVAEGAAEIVLGAAPSMSEEALSQPHRELDESQPRDAAKHKPEPRRGRKPFPPELPREPIVVPVPEAQQSCEHCGERREVIGHEESEVLEYIPASFVVKRIRREKRACRKCRNRVLCAPAVPKVHERGAYGPGLIAQVLVAKFKDHLPLYRQRQIYKRGGVDLPRSTLGDAVAGSTFALRPVAERIAELVRAAPIVQTDDTGLRVLDRDHPSHIKRGVLWPYVAGDLAYFDYTPTRAGEGPQQFLRDYQGYLQVDGYSGYDALFGEGSPRIEVGCWAHARRYFYVALEAGELRAAEPLALIQKLYRVERQAREEGLAPEARQALRGEAAAPVLEELRVWLEKNAGTASPKSQLGQAIHYTHKRMTCLRRYLDDGRLEIDNNKVERLVRLVAVGRKNFLFAGSDAGAERAATAYSLIATCTLNEIDPWAYLKDVLEKIAWGWPQRELDALLPPRWLQSHPQALRCTPPA